MKMSLKASIFHATKEKKKLLQITVPWVFSKRVQTDVALSSIKLIGDVLKSNENVLNN